MIVVKLSFSAYYEERKNGVDNDSFIRKRLGRRAKCVISLSRAEFISKRFTDSIRQLRGWFWKRDRMAAASGNAVNMFTRVHFPRLSITFVFSIRPFLYGRKFCLPRVAYFCCAIKVPRGSRERQRGAEIVFKSANAKKKKKKKRARATALRF